MIIEDPDAFKTWLTAVLKPICEADPAALAKYVIALVKKDKSPDALHQSMVNQLQVFLQDETKPFVDQLFRTLENQAYVSTPTIPNTNPPNPQLSKVEIPTKAPLSKPIIPVAEIAAISETLNGKGVIAASPVKESKDDKPPRRRSRRRSLSRGRSRSRSWDRNRRSRSREKKPVRAWRNKSPWRHERRRSASPSGRIRSRSRSPRHGYRGGGRYRNRSPPRSRSHSRSPPAGKEREESGNGTPTAQQEGNHDASDQKQGQKPLAGTQETRKRRCRDYDEEGYCMRGGMCPYDHGVDAVVLEDAALSRVLYPNGSNDGLLGPPPSTAPPHMMHPRPNMPTEYNPQAPQMWHQRGPGGFRGGHRGGMNQGPPRPRMPMGPFQGGPPQIPPLPNIQRELISVPVLGSEATPIEKYQPPSSGHGYHPENMFKKKQFDFNRLGPRQKNLSNCSLELKKVPTGLNNITHLNNHFAKFGKIVNIQVSFEGDPEAAIVTFSSHAEANVAYRSTEAVLNNRFIKVFWHSSGGPTDANKDNPHLPAAVVRSVKERLGQGGNVPPNANKFLNLANQVTAIDPDKEKENTQSNRPEVVDEEQRLKEMENRKAQQTLAIKKKQELLAVKEKLKKNQEEKRKEAMKLTQDLRKRKQDLLEKQIAQQKLLIDKMSKCPPGGQRDLLLQTIKKSQESIEVIRKDLAQAVETMKTSTALPIKRSKEAMQKELLDAELDLIGKQAEGVDTTELQKKLWDLKARVGVGVMPQVVPVRGRGRGTRRFNPLGRHKLVKNNLSNTDGQGLSPTKAHAVDHRPTRLLVSGYEGDEQENVLAHFRQFGDIVDYVSDDALPSVIVNYKTRKEAEIAFNKAKHFQDRTLSVTWYNQNQVQRQQSRTVLISESDEDQLIDSVALLDGDDDMVQELSEDVLLQDDEEEEEESEDRSWRR